MMKRIHLSVSVAVLTLGLYAHVLYAQSTPTPTPTPPPPALIFTPVGVSDSLTNTLDMQTQTILTANSELEKLGSSPQAVPIAKSRQALMKAVAKKDARRFLSVTLGSKARVALAPEAQQYVEKRDTTTGTLEVMHIDDFQNHDNSRFEYTLRAVNRKYSILSPTPILPINGGKVSVDAYALDDLMVLAEGDPSMVPLAGQGSKEALGNQRVLALITEMNGETSPVTIAEVKKSLFNITGPFQYYYTDQSYGKVWFTGEVYKIKLDRAVGEGCGSGLEISQTDIILALKDQNINLDNFDRILFIPPVGYCSVVGKGEVTIEGKKYMLSQSWVSWVNFKYNLDNNTLSTTLAHELGHALGVMHANFLLCDKEDSCRHQEYGNPFDVMGGAGFGDFNALYKEQLNWLTPADFVTITSAGDYNIQPLEDKKGIRAAKIINPSIGPLSIMYLETRKNGVRIDFPDISSQRNSLLLNIPQRPKDLKQTDVELMDMTPGVPGWNIMNWNPTMAGGPSQDKKNVALGPGAMAYTPDSSGVTIGSVKQETGEVAFHIAISKPICNPKPPQIQPDDYVQKITQDQSTGIGTSFINVDPICSAPSDFSIEFKNLPTGWSIDTTGISVPSGPPDLPKTTVKMVAPRDRAYLQTTVHIPLLAPPDIYTINYEIKNIRSGLVAKGSKKIQVFAKPAILSIYPSPVLIGKDMMITGKNFDKKNKVVFNEYVNDDWQYATVNGIVPIDGTRQGEQVLKLTMPSAFCKWSKTQPVCEGYFPALSGYYSIYVQTDNFTADQFGFSVKGQNNISSSTITILSPTSDEIVEKGKSYNIKYKAEGVSNIKIDLMDSKGNKVIRNIESNASGDSTSYYRNVPNDIDLDRDNIFTIRISDASNSQNQSKSGKFTIIEYNEPGLEVTENIFSIEYDSNRKEASVVSKVKVKVIASKDVDLIIPKQWAFSIASTNTDNRWAGEDQTTYTSTSGTSNYYPNSYKIAKGKSANFELTTRFNPKVMFAGSYKAFVNGFAYGVNYDNYKSASENNSNTVTIIGETTPYITSSTNPAYANETFTLTGERFGSAIVGVIFNGKQISLTPMHNGNVDIVTFIPQKYEVGTGLSKIQLLNEEGASNIFYLELLPAKTAFGKLKEQFANVLQAIEEIFKFFSPFEAHAESSCLILRNTLHFRSEDSATQGEVSKLQQFLKSQGYFSGEVSGFYGRATAQAVMNFQRTNNIIASDGNPWTSAVIGKKTQEKITTITCKSATFVKTSTPSPTVTPTTTPTPIVTQTPVYTYTPTPTPTATYSPTSTPIPISTPSPTPIVTSSPSSTPTPTQTPTGTPNLVANSVSVSGSPTGVSNQLYTGSMTIYGVINNNGTAPSSASTARFQYSTNNDYFVDWVSQSVPSLPQGQSQSLSYTWTGGTGTYYFRLCTANNNCSSPVRVDIINKPVSSPSSSPSPSPSSSPVSKSSFVSFFANVFEGIRNLFWK